MISALKNDLISTLPTFSDLKLRLRFGSMVIAADAQKKVNFKAWDNYNEAWLYRTQS